MKTLIFFIGLMCLVYVKAAEESILPDEEGECPEETLEEPPASEDLERVLQGPVPTQENLDAMSIQLRGSEISRMINPYLQYYKPKPTIRCCPEKWKYQCRSSSYRMPCFYDSKYGHCCPVLPQIYARRCLCSSCAVLTPTCATTGYCARRYTKRWLLAACRTHFGFWFLKSFVRSVPSSCYCRTGRIALPMPLPIKETMA